MPSFSRLSLSSFMSKINIFNKKKQNIDPQNQSALGSLPKEILNLIFLLLSSSSIVNIGKTCKKLFEHSFEFIESGKIILSKAAYLAIPKLVDVASTKTDKLAFMKEELVSLQDKFNSGIFDMDSKGMLVLKQNYLSIPKTMEIFYKKFKKHTSELFKSNPKLELSLPSFVCAAYKIITDLVAGKNSKDAKLSIKHFNAAIFNERISEFFKKSVKEINLESFEIELAFVKDLFGFADVNKIAEDYNSAVLAYLKDTKEELARRMELEKGNSKSNNPSGIVFVTYNSDDQKFAISQGLYSQLTQHNQIIDNLKLQDPNLKIDFKELESA